MQGHKTSPSMATSASHSRKNSARILVANEKSRKKGQQVVVLEKRQTDGSSSASCIQKHRSEKVFIPQKKLVVAKENLRINTRGSPEKAIATKDIFATERTLTRSGSRGNLLM